MKDKFIEKDGDLFLRCEPEPLDIDKPELIMPSCSESWTRSKDDN